MSRTLAIAAILALAACALAGADPPAKKLIEYGWDVPGPVYVAQHIRQMEQRPFDGLIMRVPKIGQIFAERNPTGPEVDAALAALPRIRWQRFTDNFICMYAASQMDWFSDADWEWVLRNVTLCARAARLGRCKGVTFDAEPYGTRTPGSTPSSRGPRRSPLPSTRPRCGGGGRSSCRRSRPSFPGRWCTPSSCSACSTAG